MLCYAMLCYAMLCYVALCCVVFCSAMLCYAVLCYVVLCYAMLCYVMLCYVVEKMLKCKNDQHSNTLAGFLGIGADPGVSWRLCLGRVLGATFEDVHTN